MSSPTASTNKETTTVEIHSTKVNEYEDAEKNFQLTSIKFWTVIVGVFLSIFLVALDRMIIATAIPSITDEFHSIQDIGWYGSGYMLTAACFNPISGRVYQLYSTKWIFIGSVIIFEAGSALCGAAPNSTSLIVGRAIAGLGSASIFSGGMMILMPMVPLRKRAVFTSFFGLCFGVSSILGPIIGGTFTDHVTWRWCFYLNLPIGGFTLLAILFFFNPEEAKREKTSIMAQLKRLDPVGILFFVPSMVCLILALQWGGTTYSWSNPKIIGLLVTFSVLFVAFLIVEIYTPETAMAPTRVVLNRSVGGSMAYMFVLSGGLMSVLYYLTIWFQAVKNDSAMRAGISTIPMLLSFIIMGVFAATFTQKIGYYNVSMLVSPAFCSIGAGMLSTLSPTSGHSVWIGYQVLYGVGIGCGFQTSTLPAQNVLPRKDVPLGMALIFFMQQLGGAVFIAISQNVFSSNLVDNLSGIEGLDAQAIINTGATALRKIVPTNQLVTVTHAYNHALTRVFVLVAGISASMIIGALLVEWKRIQGTKKEQPDSASSDPKVEESRG